MSKKYMYFSVMNYEWLQPTGDSSRLIINYSIADDETGISNKQDKSIIVKLSRNAEMGAKLENELDKAQAVIAYIQNLIKSAILENNELPLEITITSYDDGFPPELEGTEFDLGNWVEVAIEKRIGFL